LGGRKVLGIKWTEGVGERDVKKPIRRLKKAKRGKTKGFSKNRRGT